ncbi:hypothetical protein ACEWPL_002495 [Roseovarius sp. S1116L3]
MKPVQNTIGFKGFGLFIDLNIDRFLVPGALAAALFLAAFISSF